MEFNSQICTTRSQSERLLALGVQKDIDTSVSFIGGLTIWLAISLIVYLTIRFSIRAKKY